ncbi:MAG: hypothetical protein CVU38_18720 [Chloroflexi bacterium HGW-Chloroflexi-1]|nr:MAG: hypothetical protein CVU38_18720 [Chloroflexi bacterium HGW-Chloroflexi-1]
MKTSLRARYKKMNWQQQLGNMASTLARVSNNVTISEHDEVVSMCLREAACFIEWSAPAVPSEILLELATMQRELLTWQRVWPIEAARSLLALYARNQSDRILHMAGFYSFGDKSPVAT